MTHSIYSEADFTELIEKNKKLIYKVANAYCRDYEDRKDLVQEIILQLWKSFQKYDSNFAVSTWMYRIALNVSISYLRKETARKKTFDTFSIEHGMLESDETIATDENLKLLYEIIDRLKPLDKAVIILFLDGCKNKEISEIMGITESNVSTKIHRIKEFLSKNFKTTK